MRVVQVEVTTDDRNRQSNDQHTTNCAGASDDFARPGLRGEITISHSCHGNKAPPKGLWNWVKVWLFVQYDFNIVHDAGEHDHWDQEHEKKKNQFVGTGLQSVDHNLETIRQLYKSAIKQFKSNHITRILRSLLIRQWYYRLSLLKDTRLLTYLNSRITRMTKNIFTFSSSVRNET